MGGCEGRLAEAGAEELRVGGQGARQGGVGRPRPCAVLGGVCATGVASRAAREWARDGAAEYSHAYTPAGCGAMGGGMLSPTVFRWGWRV